MANYEFNQSVLDKLLDSKDPDLIDFAEDAITAFNDYTITVANFTDNIINLSKESPELYRTAAVDLDTKRRSQHNVCMNKIDGLNRLARNEFKSEPFCDLHGAIMTSMVNRTDLGDAILTWSYENLHNITENQLSELGLKPIESSNNNNQSLKSYIKNKNETTEEETLMKNYNSLMRDNRYPMIKQKGNEYAFIHFLTQKEVDPEMVFHYCNHQLKDKHKDSNENIDIVNSAKNQVYKTHLHKEPLTNHIKKSLTQSFELD